MKIYTYSICHPDGNIRRMRVPSLFGPFDVARRLIHSLVFLHVPKGATVSTKNAGFSAGPCLVYQDEMYEVPELPQNDGHAFHLWKSLGL